jgi:hypothetical protein
MVLEPELRTGIHPQLSASVETMHKSIPEQSRDMQKKVSHCISAYICISLGSLEQAAFPCFLCNPYSSLARGRPGRMCVQHDVLKS